MTNLEMWALIVGFVLPPVLAVIQQTSWSNRLRAVVAFLACLAAGTGTVFLQQEDISWTEWVSTTLLVLVTAIATYQSFWKPTGIAPGIETKTNV